MPEPGEEGLISEQYNALDGNEVTKTFAITAKGIAWLKRLGETRDSGISRRNLLSFPD